jgi:L-amino acid N-acyltransferase YncA
MTVIRAATEGDRRGIWAILEPVIRAGETYTLPIDMPKSEAIAYWMSSEKETFVAEDSGLLLGTYYMRHNQLGGGSHVANCGYITKSGEHGRGVARSMCRHSLAHAAQRGFRAMQFNFVVSTNVRAVSLWTSMGFDTVGILPQAFHHPSGKDVDALIMYRAL